MTKGRASRPHGGKAPRGLAAALAVNNPSPREAALAANRKEIERRARTRAAAAASATGASGGRGSGRGSRNRWSDGEYKKLFALIESKRPHGANHWEMLTSELNLWNLKEGRKERDVLTVKKKWSELHCAKKPTGSSSMPCQSWLAARRRVGGLGGSPGRRSRQRA